MLDFNKLKEISKDKELICAVHNDDVLYYHELYNAVLSLSTEIYSKVPNDNSPILLIGDKENLYIAGLLSVLYCGHAYVAVSASFPYERIKFIAESCGATAVLNFSTVDFEQFNKNWYNQNDIEKIAKSITDDDNILPPHVWKDSELFAVFYTSGSTGKPKGVKVSYENMACNIRRNIFLAESYLVDSDGEQPVSLNFSSYGFIASAMLIFYNVCDVGAKLYAVDRALLSDYSALIKYIIKVNPRQFSSTPSFLDICLKSEDFSQKNLPKLQAVYIGGGAINSATVKKFKERFSSAVMINCYGMTETVGTALYYSSSEMEDFDEPLMPSGYPVPETEAEVMNESGDICKDGETGELHVFSKSIAMGYFDTDKQLAYLDKNGRRGYRTGDLFVKKNGLLYYLGRTDSMVKVGSYRVELFDVENNLIALEPVKNAIVVPCRENGDVKLLAAYIVLQDGVMPNMATTIQIKKMLREKIQPYALPQIYKYVEKIPLTPNAKPDRGLLEKMATKDAFNN